MTSPTTSPRRPPKVPRPTPAPRVRSPLIDRLVPADVPMFWERIAERLPLVEETDTPGEVIVTFCWGDHDAEAVLLVANRLTDASQLADTLLERMPDTDLWHASFRMRSDWRASYTFVTQRPGEPAPWEVADGPTLKAALDRGQVDRRNPESCPQRDGGDQSVVSLPDAPAQPWLAPRPDVPAGTLTALAGPDGRDVWVHDPAGIAADEPLPVVIALDGEVWTGAHDLPTIVDNMIADRVIPPVRLCMPTSGGIAQRWDELTDRDGPALAMLDDLIAWMHARGGAGTGVTVAGQSLGGLTALRAGLLRPDVVTGVVSQSASLWVDDLEDAIEPGNPVRIHLAHGTQEWVLAPPHEQLARRLDAAGLDVTAAPYNGGHDYAWWRGALADGLRHVLA